MREVVIEAVLYFMVGTVFLVMLLCGYLKLDMQNKRTGEWLDKNSKLYQMFMLSFCLYWPLVVLMLIIGGRKKEDE